MYIMPGLDVTDLLQEYELKKAANQYSMIP
jgi:hypothetical protein